MLPALQLRCEPGEGHSFTCRPQWVRPLESLWSILAKWQFVNCLPYSTIVATLMMPSATTPDQGVDLRVLSPFHLDAFVEHSGLSQNLLASAACCSSTNSRILGLVSQHLRFCAVCMQEGFHAALFQFAPIRSCPIHHCRLHNACPHCQSKIPYRLDPSFAAHPFACPHCAFSVLADPTALARQSHDTAAHETMMAWQRFLATYVHWFRRYQRLNENGTGLGFIGALQDLLDEPPPIPMLWMPMITNFSAQPGKIDAPTNLTKPTFSRLLWPHFWKKNFLSLYHRYQHFLVQLQALTSPRQRQVTHWWRRSWEGAVNRSYDATTMLEFPPFGISEWLSFSILPSQQLLSDALLQYLTFRFEHDLRTTWQAWHDVLEHVENDACSALHPYLVPPRACWLSIPIIEPGSTALGFS